MGGRTEHSTVRSTMSVRQIRYSLKRQIRYSLKKGVGIDRT